MSHFIQQDLCIRQTWKDFPSLLHLLCLEVCYRLAVQICVVLFILWQEACHGSMIPNDCCQCVWRAGTVWLLWHSLTICGFGIVINVHLYRAFHAWTLTNKTGSRNEIGSQLPHVDQCLETVHLHHKYNMICNKTTGKVVYVTKYRWQPTGFANISLK